MVMYGVELIELCAMLLGSWIGTFTAQLRENSFSDHSPIHIDLAKASRSNKRPFRLLSILADNDKFLQLVATV